MYLSYQNGESSGVDYSKFTLKRGYFTLKKEVLPWFSARMTTDIFQVSDSVKVDGKSNNDDGSWDVRIKYLYGQFNLSGNSFLTKPTFEFGMVPTPWIDFEQKINFYRMQDSMFTDRAGIFSSADAGLTFNALLGGTVGEDYQKTVTKEYPGRFGSVSLGVYNGGGYKAAEKNEDKTLQARVTVRPLPDVVPGLQFSYLGVSGKGNNADEYDWSANMGFMSFEHQYLTLTGTYYTGTGNYSGSDENDKDGYSLFTEIKPMDKVSFIGRYDVFDPNTSADDDGNNRYIVGVAYMLDKPHKNMILLDYESTSYELDSKPEDNRIQLTLQVSL